MLNEDSEEKMAWVNFKSMVTRFAPEGSKELDNPRVDSVFKYAWHKGRLSGAREMLTHSKGGVT